MPHFIVEYTDNIKEDADIPGLLRKLHATMLAQNGVFPLGGIRLRAHELKHYFVADGNPENAFVHAVLKIGQGRSPEVKAKVCQELFATMKAHFFSPGKEDRPLALSMEFHEFDENGTFRHNTIHARLKAKAQAK